MILADKIISLRKKAGMTQEELAEALCVTRQSVSKWEGAQSVPDMDKILQLSRLFGVTTDYLLKDEMEDAEFSCESNDTHIRRVSMEQASEYLSLRKAAAPKLALATFLCIVSPIPLLLLGALSEIDRFHISENAAGGIGLCMLFLLVAAGVTIFISCASASKDYNFLSEETFETEYGVCGMAKERKKEYGYVYTRLNIFGTVLCILSVIPLFIALCFDASDISYVIAVCLMFFIVGLGCVSFVYAGTYQGAIDRLLEEGEYTRKKKERSRISGVVTTVYWAAVTVIFLLCTFLPSCKTDPRDSWIIWAVAGVIYGALAAVMNLIGHSEK